MAKLYSRSIITIATRCEEGVNNVPSDEEYHVRGLGRGLWSVEDEGGFFRRVFRTAELQRFIRGLSRRYIGGYWSSGEPQFFVKEVSIYRE